MNVNVNITIDFAPQLYTLLQGFFGTLMQPATTPSQNGKTRKMEKVADKAPDPVQETEPEETGSDAPKATGEKITVEMIRALLPEKKQLVGTQKVKELLNKYNVPNVTSLPQDKYHEFYSELKNLAA
jgi:hypothetical protein